MAALRPWGRLPGSDFVTKRVVDPERYLEGEKAPFLVVGSGRSYGDVCVPVDRYAFQACNSFISFDEISGIVSVHAGVKIRVLLEFLARRKRTLAVVPGTSEITVGGAVANDVHGKNHEISGSFGCYIVGLELFRTDFDAPVRLTSADHGDLRNLFFATIGGIGLTGMINEVQIQTVPLLGNIWDVEVAEFNDIAEYMALSKAFGHRHTHVAAWVDCTKPGAGLLFGGRVSAGDWSAKMSSNNDSRLSMPSLGINLVTKATNVVFNRLYRWSKLRQKTFKESQDSFLFPLDGISNWNRVYGNRGFYQCQFVVSKEYALKCMDEVLFEIKSSRQGSMLSVLKEMGPTSSGGWLSFPMAGTTFAIDIPNTKGALSLVTRINSIVDSWGGRIYLAKDASLCKEHFERMYPLVDQFKRFKDPAYSSVLSRRLLEY